MLRAPSCLRFAPIITDTHAKLGYHPLATGFMGQNFTDSGSIQLHGTNLNNSSRSRSDPYGKSRKGRKEQKSATRYSPLAAGGLPYFES